jgi:hypothetical protein
MIIGVYHQFEGDLDSGRSEIITSAGNDVSPSFH